MLALNSPEMLVFPFEKYESHGDLPFSTLIQLNQFCLDWFLKDKTISTISSPPTPSAASPSSWDKCKLSEEAIVQDLDTAYPLSPLAALSPPHCL